MIKDYILYMDNSIQKDFNRYISLAESFDTNKLDIAASFCKIKLKDYLQIAGGFTKNITIRLFETSEYVYDIIFNFNNKDIYIKLEHKHLSGHDYTANILLGEKNVTTTDLIDINNDDFINEVITPMKLIFVMYHKQIINFINKNWEDVMNTDTFINTTFNLLNEEK